MRIFISTGEVSGDLQGAMLVEALYRQAAARNIRLEIIALGGDRMAAAGANLIGNTTRIGAVGLLESLPFVIPTLKLQQQAKKYLKTHPPDIVVLIDYPGPNKVIGSYVKKQPIDVPIVYYIAPQDWAVPMLGNSATIAQITDKLLAIFPAEANYFQQKGVKVQWVGHPLLDRLELAPNQATARKQLGFAESELIITLLPASRRQEVKSLLPIILTTAQIIQQQLPQAQFLLPLSLSAYREQVLAALAEYSLNIKIVENQTLAAIAAADLAIAKSGTVNLEIALLDVPQVVVYRVSPLTAWIARTFLKINVPLMSPPNLVVDREIVPEFQQEKAIPAEIAQTALELLQNPIKQQQIISEYQQMRQKLGEPGVSDRAADAILNLATI